MTTETVADPRTPGAPLLRRRYRVRLVDTDAAQLIYYGAVFRWAEIMFTDWLAAAGRPLSTHLETGIGFPAVRTEAEYLHPLGLDDELELQLRPHHVGEHSFALQTTGLLLPDRRESLVVRVWHTYVELVRRQGTTTPDVRVAPLPRWVRTALQKVEEIDAEPLPVDAKTDTDISGSHRQGERSRPQAADAPREQVT